jgi:hypothetical protein
VRVWGGGYCHGRGNAVGHLLAEVKEQFCVQ